MAERWLGILLMLLTFFPAGAGALTVDKKLSHDPEDGAILWQGFHHEWKKTPHRLNRIGSYFREVSYDEDAATVSAEHRSIFRVGAYDDTGIVRTTGTFFKSAALGIHHGYVDESCLKLSGEVGEKAAKTCPQSVDLAAIGFDGYDSVTVVLRGFQLNAKSYDAGYNTRGFTVRLVPAGLRGGSYEFDAVMAVHPEHSPDRPQLDDKCWEDDHCKRYRYEGRIYYTLIGVASGRGALTESDADAGTNSYAQLEHMSPYEVPDEIPEYRREAWLNGLAGFKHALVAVQGFSWRLKEWDDFFAKDGRYIRDLEMNVSHIDYDAQEGRAKFFTNMYFSNSGALPLGFEAEFRMWNVLIQTDDIRFEKSDKAWFDGRIGSGGSDFVETAEYGF